jgi:hypothetical protein
MYEQEWRDYRKRRKFFWVIFFTFLPGVVAIGLPLQLAFKSELPVYITALIWMAAFVISGCRLTFWPCPRCKKWYFTNWLSFNQFSNKCFHCKLDKWETKA